MPNYNFEEASASADAAHSLGVLLLMFATSRAPEDRDSLVSLSSEEASSAKSRFNSLKVQAANAMHTCSSNNVDVAFFNEIQILAAEMATVLDAYKACDVRQGARPLSPQG